jgi:hypothetical protein
MSCSRQIRALVDYYTDAELIAGEPVITFLSRFLLNHYCTID